MQALLLKKIGYNWLLLIYLVLNLCEKQKQNLENLVNPKRAGEVSYMWAEELHFKWL